MSTKSTSNAIEPKVVRYDYAYESSSKIQTQVINQVIKRLPIIWKLKILINIAKSNIKIKKIMEIKVSKMIQL